MQRLYFGARARRRARMRRLLILTSIASMASMAVGSTGPNPLQLFGKLTGLEQDQPLVIAGGVETSESARSLMRFRSNVIDSRPAAKPKPKPDPQPEPEAETTEASTSGIVRAQAQRPPRPAPPPNYSPKSIRGIITAAAREFGLDHNYLIGVAECESGLNPRAYNPAGYYGLFQFDRQTWEAYGYGDIYNPTAQSRTAARLIAAGQKERWPNCA